MVTITYEDFGTERRVNADGTTSKVKTVYCNSGDVKPKKADGMLDADRCIERDTGNLFLFDYDLDDWVKM